MTSSNTFTDYLQYLNFTYGLDWTVLLNPLEDFANVKSTFSDDRKYILSRFGFSETFLNLDSMRTSIKFELRRGNPLFKQDECLAFLRFNILLNIFERLRDEHIDTDEDFRQYCLNHPLWPRLEKQARVTLELFKKNKFRRPLTTTKP